MPMDVMVYCNRSCPRSLTVSCSPGCLAVMTNSPNEFSKYCSCIHICILCISIYKFQEGLVIVFVCMLV